MLDDFVRSVLAVSWWMRSTCRLDWSAAGLPFRISQTEVFGFLVKQHIGVGHGRSKHVKTYDSSIHKGEDKSAHIHKHQHFYILDVNYIQSLSTRVLMVLIARFQTHIFPAWFHPASPPATQLPCLWAYDLVMREERDAVAPCSGSSLASCNN